MSGSLASRRRRALWEIERAIHGALESLSSTPAVQSALCSLIGPVRTHSRLLRAAPSGGRRGWNDAVYYLQGLVALARHGADWLREPESFRAMEASPLLQFGELARHLLAAKPVPRFMTGVWLVEPSAESRRWQIWFKHVGRVGTIRGSDALPRITRQMARMFSLAPDHSEMAEALQFARFKEIPRQPRPVYPAAPSRRRRKRAIGRQGNGCGMIYPQAPFAGWSFVEPATSPWDCRRWTIRQLRTRAELHCEGKRLSHCVGGYHNLCARGMVSIWSLRTSGRLREERHLTIEVLRSSRRIIQARGLRNRDATAEEREILRRWAEQESLVVGI